MKASVHIYNAAPSHTTFF